MKLLADEKIENNTLPITINCNNKEKKYTNIYVFVMIFLSIFLFVSIEWLYHNTGNLTIEQLIFLLKVPLQGTNSDMIWQYILQVIPLSILIAVLMKIIIINYREKIIFKYAEKIIFLISIMYIFTRADVFGYVSHQITSSSFIENNYANIEEEEITFPEQKNNLIYIYLESMESSYTSKENGGMYEDDYIKELRKIAEDNIHFSNTNKLGGALQLTTTNWTIAGIVAQTSGLPLKISIEQNSYGKYDTFLPGIKSIGEILQDNGYKNYFILGSDSAFGGRRNYFSQHGNYEIWDYNTAIEKGKIRAEDKVWWGYDDNDLFKFAKEQLLEISKDGQPFNYTMLTVDTHFTDGYICSKCEDIYDTQYANVIACSSKQVAEFVNWIKEQEFYKNTTIIISGDHLTMQILNEEKNYQRTIYNAIINPSPMLDISNIRTTNRKFSSLDMFPTTLAALGVKINGDCLGLGTNLFSEKQTLIERYGYEIVNNELDKKSTFYNQKFLYNK